MELHAIHSFTLVVLKFHSLRKTEIKIQLINMICGKYLSLIPSLSIRRCFSCDEKRTKYIEIRRSKNHDELRLVGAFREGDEQNSGI